MSVNGKRAAINFFDLSGDEDYADIRNPFFQDSQGILLVFDQENKESFKNLSRWEKLMKDSGVDPKRSVIIVVGNKSDSKNKVRIILNNQEVTNEEVTKYVKSKGYEYFQSSASTGENVAEVSFFLKFKIFERLFSKVMDQIDEQKK